MTSKTYTVYVDGEIVDTEASMRDIELLMESYPEKAVVGVENVRKEVG